MSQSGSQEIYLFMDRTIFFNENSDSFIDHAGNLLSTVKLQMREN